MQVCFARNALIIDLISGFLFQASADIYFASGREFDNISPFIMVKNLSSIDAIYLCYVLLEFFM